MKRNLTWILLGLVALAFVVTHFMWLPELPQRVASHFDASGKANGWMSRGKHSTFMVLTGLGLPAFVMVVCWMSRLFPANMMNVPNPGYWRLPENHPRLCAILFQWSQWQAISLLLFTTGLNYQVVAANRQTPPHLPSSGTWQMTVGFLALEAAMIIWLLWRFTKTDSPSKEGKPALT